MKNALILAVVMAVAAAAGFATRQYLNQEDDTSHASRAIGAVIGQPRPEFAMRDIEGTVRNIRDWDGQVILLNFWATWCPPCLREMPAFIELQHEYGEQGLQIVGVAMDNEANVIAFAEQLEVNYPLMAGDADTIELAKRYGNTIGALPYTVIIDRNGTISNTFAGELSKSRALKSLKQAGLQAKKNQGSSD